MAWPRGLRTSHTKYGSTQSLCSLGHSHRSKLERAVCEMLALLQKAGEIELLGIEQTVYLSDARIRYIPDFKCRNLKSGEIYYVESKGFEAARWPTIKKLWKAYGEAPLMIYKGTHLRPVHVETIVPTARSK